MNGQNACGCTGGTKLIFACSGAADVGAVADLAARKLTREGVGKMFCTVGIGGRVAGILKTTEAAESILAIDGCPLNCVKNSLLHAGFTAFKHLQLADLGLVKGQTPVTDDAVNKAAAEGRELIG